MEVYEAETVVEPTREGGKTRTFSAELLAWVRVDGFFEPSKSKGTTIRPAWLCFAATALQARAVVANLKLGRSLRAFGFSGPNVFEVARTANFRWEVSPEKGGAVIVVAYEPSVFALHSAEVSTAIRFVAMPPDWWLDREEVKLAERFGDKAREVATALYVTAYLDQRTKLPILATAEFRLALFRAAQKQKWCRTIFEAPVWSNYRAKGLDTLGISEAWAIDANQTIFGEFLSKLTRKYLAKHGEEVRAVAHG